MSEFLPVRVIDSAPPIYAVKIDENQIGATLRSLCTALDLARHAQAARIRRDPVLAGALVVVVLDSPGGLQQTEVLLDWAISIWLSGLNINRLSEEKQALVFHMQQKAVDLIRQAFAKTKNKEAPASEAAAPEAATPQSVWQEGHAFLDHLQAEHEGLRQEQRNVYNHLAVVQHNLHGQARRITALEAGKASPSGGLSDAQLGYIYRRAHQVHQQHGYPLAEILAGLAAHFHVEDVYYLSDKDWPGVLEWFASLLEEG